MAYKGLRYIFAVVLRSFVFQRMRIMLLRRAQAAYHLDLEFSPDPISDNEQPLQEPEL